MLFAIAFGDSVINAFAPMQHSSWPPNLDVSCAEMNRAIRVPSTAIREDAKRRGRVVFLQREEAPSGSQLGCFAALGSQRGDP